MQYIGIIKTNKLSENEFSCEWGFRFGVEISDLNNSYLSELSGTSLCEKFSGLQLAIVPDKLQPALQFLLFIYGFEGRSGSKITFNVCLAYPDNSTGNLRSLPYSINCSDVCLAIEPSVKILEVHSSNGIFHAPLNSTLYDGQTPARRYVLKIKMKLHEELILSPTFSNKYVALPDIKKNNCASYNADPKSAQDHEYPKELIRDLEALCTSGNMSDVGIRIGEDVLLAHKSILCARSPVFKGMMEHDCLESSSNSITITDCPLPPFKKFLKYLYTGKLEDRTDETVMSLYSLSDKYDVPALRRACSDLLQTKLSFEPVEDVADIVCDVLQLAVCHNDKQLEDVAAGFIAKHFPVVSNKQGWKDLMKSNFELTSNILSRVVATSLQNVRV